MIIPGDQARLILAGRKTQHRIPRKPGQVRCPYRGGGSYVMRSGARELGRVFVFSVGSQRLEDISEQEAYTEGFKSRDDFLEYWRETYPPSYHAGDEPITHVWVLVVEPEDERRLLVPAARGSAASEHGYTSNPARAMRGEPEAVDEQAQRRITADAEMLWGEHQEWRAEQLERRSLQKRLYDLECGPRSSVVVKEMRVVRQKLERMRDKLEER